MTSKNTSAFSFFAAKMTIQVSMKLSNVVEKIVDESVFGPPCKVPNTPTRPGSGFEVNMESLRQAAHSPPTHLASSGF
jgi:hypothetical protein